MSQAGLVGGLGLLGLLALPGAAGAQAPVLTNPIGMEFVLIQPGTMTVGRFQPTCPTPGSESPDVDPRLRWSPEDYRRCEELAREQARPGFPVIIEHPFYVGRYEVTQAEWERVMGSNPSYFRGSRVEGGDASRHPVERVTWEMAAEFITRLNALDTTAVYRLPTELEWEYAARAGAEGEPSWQTIRESGWIAQVDKGSTHPVGQKQPNLWGVYDALGNVWEWVADWYNGELFPDPVPPRSGTVHVLRGGGFLSDVKNATWFFHAGGPGNGWDVGFRVVREAGVTG